MLCKLIPPFLDCQRMKPQQTHIASMGVYVFKIDVLRELLDGKYPSSNDFGSEIIPAAVGNHNVQAYLFNDYCEDVGTIKSFFDANLALTEQPPKFQFYDPKTHFYISSRFLPPTKVDKCKIVNSILSHGCSIHECSIDYRTLHSRNSVSIRVMRGVSGGSYTLLPKDIYLSSILAEIGENIQKPTL